MKLHLDKEAFRVLIDTIHTQTGYRGDVLEKDYYVSLILKELAEKQSNGLPAYFKGGTALYKALKTTNRFSEDIDLSVDTRNCSRTQNDRRLEYDVGPFSIMTISMERVFIDKLFAAEAYVRKAYEPHRAFEAAKHIYDLAVIYKHKTVSKLLSDTGLTKKLLDIRIAEEINRLDGIPNVLPSDFIFFTNSMNNKDIRKAYEIMQNQYVLRDCDRIDYDKAMDALTDIYKSLLNNTSWVKYQF